MKNGNPPLVTSRLIPDLEEAETLKKAQEVVGGAAGGALLIARAVAELENTSWNLAVIENPRAFAFMGRQKSTPIATTDVTPVAIVKNAVNVPAVAYVELQTEQNGQNAYLLLSIQDSFKDSSDADVVLFGEPPAAGIILPEKSTLYGLIDGLVAGTYQVKVSVIPLKGRATTFRGEG